MSSKATVATSVLQKSDNSSLIVTQRLVRPGRASSKTAFREQTDTGKDFVRLTYAQLMAELTNLVESRSSGTLYIRSDCNHAISFVLESGQVTALYFGPRKGRKAIPLILGITGGSCRFEDSGRPGIRQDLPPVEEILELLRANESAAQSESPVDAEAETWHKILEELQTVLTDHLGPIAGIIYEEALAELGEPCVTQDSFQRLIENLAVNIEPDQITRFYDQVAGVLDDN